MSTQNIDTYDKNGNFLRTIHGYQAEALGPNEYLRGVSCIVRIGQKILLTVRTKGRDAAGFLDFCSGHLEQDEDPEVGMRRELSEELGIFNEASTDIVWFATHPLTISTREKEKHWILDFFFLQLPETTVLCPQDEELEAVKLVDLPEFLQLVKTNQLQFAYPVPMQTLLAQLQKHIATK